MVDIKIKHNFNKQMLLVSSKSICFFITILITHNCLAQFEKEFRKNFNYKPKLDIKFDSRISFLTNDNVTTKGIKIGVAYNKRVKFGLGINNMLTPVKSKRFKYNDSIDVKLIYAYFSPYIEYVYFLTKKWEFSLSLQMGIGGSHYEYTDSLSNKLKIIRNGAMISYEPATFVDYKIIRYIGIGSGVGYRLMLYKNSYIKEQFTSPMYIFKFKVYLGEIWRGIRGIPYSID